MNLDQEFMTIKEAKKIEKLGIKETFIQEEEDE